MLEEPEIKVVLPTRVENTTIKLSDEEGIKRCHEAHKNTTCFRERNGHSLCAGCPKSDTPYSRRKVGETINSEELNSDRSLTTEMGKSVPRTLATEILLHISEIAKIEGLSKETQELAEKILLQGEEEHIFFDRRRSAKCLAAAMLWTACQQTGEPRTQEEIAKKAEISPDILNSSYCFLRFRLDLPDLKS